MKIITIGVLYFNQKHMIRKHYESWERYQDQAEFIIIDDCSNEKIKSAPNFVKQYRITDNIPWNQTGARNLLHYVAENDWVLSMDCDHVLDIEQFKRVMKLEMSNTLDVYFLNRLFTHNAKKNRMHSTFLCNRNTFLAVGGHDEDLSGFYGAVDESWLQKVKQKLRYNWLQNIYVMNYSNDKSIVDANTSEFDRNSKRNMDLFKKKLRNNQPRGSTLRFKWERIQ
jgi:hypothetical protein